MSARMNHLTGLASGILTVLLVANVVAECGLGCRTETTTSLANSPSWVASLPPSPETEIPNLDATEAVLKQEQRKIIEAFQGRAREDLRGYYDFRLGLRTKAPPHAHWRVLLLQLEEDLIPTFVHAGVKEFVLGQLDELNRLENDAKFRKALNEFAFRLKAIPDMDTRAFHGVPRVRIYVEEPWHDITPDQLVLACNAQELLDALNSDSLPDGSQSKLAAYKQLTDASALIMEETLPNNRGATVAVPVRIERPAELNLAGTIEKHPVVIYQVTKTVLDKFDSDMHGQPKPKTFTFELRQMTHTTRDKDGRLTEHLVTHELLEPVVIGGNQKLGQYGLHFYKTALRASRIEGEEDAILVQFSVLNVPDFRGRLATSRLRRAVSVFIRLESRKVASRTLLRVKEYWPRRASCAPYEIATP